jgi:hypothetical protein
VREPGRQRVEPTVIQLDSEKPQLSSSTNSGVTVQGKVPDSGQVGCFSNRQQLNCAALAPRFRGQDGHYSAKRAYRDNGDGTISDLVTGLRWQQAHNVQRLNYSDATASCAGLELGGGQAWRLPTITELFSISDWRAKQDQHYADDRYFKLEKPASEVLINDPFRSTHNVSMMG